MQAEEAFKDQYPAIYNHLYQFKDKLSARNKAETGIRYEWYTLQRCAASYYKEFEETKIILSIFMNSSTFAFDNQGFFHNNALHLIAGVTKYTALHYQGMIYRNRQKIFPLG